MSRGSQRTMKIPLNPPFSKGENRFPPLEKGGKGGFEKLFSSESSELTTDDAQSIIKALSSLNSNLMLILTGGEPMLRGDIFDIVHSASSAGLIVVLGSNGTLLTRDSLRVLKDTGLMGVGISIDSTGSLNHDSFRGYKGAWDLSV